LKPWNPAVNTVMSPQKFPTDPRFLLVFHRWYVGLHCSRLLLSFWTYLDSTTTLLPLVPRIPSGPSMLPSVLRTSNPRDTLRRTSNVSQAREQGIHSLGGNVDHFRPAARSKNHVLVPKWYLITIVIRYIGGICQTGSRIVCLGYIFYAKMGVPRSQGSLFTTLIHSIWESYLLPTVYQTQSCLSKYLSETTFHRKHAETWSYIITWPRKYFLIQ